MDISDYKVTFSRHGALWEWEAEAPNGDTLSAQFRFIAKEKAERDALKAIERHGERETVSGSELRQRLAS